MVKLETSIEIKRASSKVPSDTQKQSEIVYLCRQDEHEGR